MVDFPVSAPSAELPGRETRCPDCKTPEGASRYGSVFRCGIADPHGVCDVKDQCGLIAEAILTVTDFSVLPGFPKPLELIAQGVPTLRNRDVHRLWKTQMGSKFPLRVFHRVMDVKSYCVFKPKKTIKKYLSIV